MPSTIASLRRVGLAAVLLAAPSAGAQTLTLVQPAHLDALHAEISGDAAYRHLRVLSQYHRPRGGSDALMTVARYVEAEARAAGLADVRLIKQASTTRPWNARFADLQIVAPTPSRIASTLVNAVHLADYSRPADVTAELVDVGAGSAAELDAANVRGKIVLTHGVMNAVMTAAVLERGAAGLVWFPDPASPPNGINGSGVSRPDQVRWVSLPPTAVDGREPTFAFVLSVRQGVDLRNQLAAAAAAREPVRTRAVVDARFGSENGEEPWQVMVEAYIRGTEPNAGQDIVLTGHMQEGLHSVNDDASGVASVLEIGRAMTKLIAEGKLPRPRRNIRLWWVTEISSQRQYFADNPDSHRRIWANINQDMVGADQSIDVMRKQNVTRVPAARFHFLNDVMESVLEYMVAANNFELAQLQNGIGLYPRPHLSPAGSMHRYNAEAIWFHENSDHMTFNEAPIGVPAVSFTNMPDRFIHSNEDDLWNVDRTQLGRNALAVSLISYAMATADTGSMRAIAAQTAGRGAERMGRNVRLGMSWLATMPDKGVALRQAEEQVRYAAERERLAVRSLAGIGPAAAPLAEALAREVDAREAQALREVRAAARAFGAPTSGVQASAPAQQDTALAALAALRPRIAGTAKDFLERRGQLGGVPGLHGLMATEILQAIDGRRTGADIYRFVAAEAREAGAHYFGVVTPAAVLQRLRNAERLALVRLN